MKRIAGIATIKGREQALEDTIDSLQNQMDDIYVFDGNKKGDAVKFDAYNKDCYYFSCDDDLIYPPDYAQRMILSNHKYDNAIITCHGRIFIPPITDYYKNGIKYHCLHEVVEDVRVDCGGTGVMMMKGQLDFKLDDFKTKNMADIWIALFANKQHKRIVCLSHKSGWIRHTDKIDLNKTIHAMNVNDCKIQTELINQGIW